jgi:hypothetical protein
VRPATAVCRPAAAQAVLLVAVAVSLGACGRPSSLGAGGPAADAHVAIDATSDAGAGAAFDLAPEDASPGPPDAPDAAPVQECTPGVRACLDRQTPRVCGDQGHWMPSASCGAGSACSGGACVCQAGACEDGVLRDLPGSVFRVAVGAGFLHYEYSQRVGAMADVAIHSIDLRTGTGTTGRIQRAPAGYRINPGLAVDAMGALHWCRRRSDDMGAAEGALMRGDQVLAPGACTWPRLTASHVYYTLDEEQGLFRRALRPDDGVGDRETVTMRSPASFAVTETHIYVGRRHDMSDRSVIERIPLGDLTRAEPLAERVGIDSPIFDDMAVDATYVYASYDDEILRTPVAGGGTFQTFASGGGFEVAAIVLTDTHVYWATHAPAPSVCSGAAFWRRSKSRDDDPVLLARHEGACPYGLALWEDRLYAAVTVRPQGSQILRLRR